MTLCKSCGFTIDGPLHRDAGCTGTAEGPAGVDTRPITAPAVCDAARCIRASRRIGALVRGQRPIHAECEDAERGDRMAGARAAFASLIQRDAWMLNRYGTGARCPIVLDGAGAYACLVHEDGSAEATSTRCSEAERLAALAAEPGPAYLGVEL
jgi:hypothetical protein